MEQLVVVLFLAFFTLEFFVEFVLNELNLRYMRVQWAAGKVPELFARDMTGEGYDKSVRYNLAKGRFQRFAAIHACIITLAVLFTGLLPAGERFAKDLAGVLPQIPHLDGILFCFGVAMICSLASMPLDLYSTFVLEARFGFNKTTWRLYTVDKLKEILLGVVIGGPFLGVVLWLMDSGGSYWWLWAFVFISGFQFLMIFAYPFLIAPWFNKFEPLKQGEFRERILALTDKVGFKTSGIFAMDGSRRSGHSNAYFTGIGKAKRIVLFDTLIEQLTTEQGLAVLAHEMGHFKMKHIRRMLVVQMVFLVVGLYLLSLLLQFRPLYDAFGLVPSSHAALVLFAFLAGPLTFYFGPLMNRLSREHEYEADRFSVATLKDGKPMEEALLSLTIRNSSNLTPHPWYSAYHYSHPTSAERIAAIRRQSPL